MSTTPAASRPRGHRFPVPEFLADEAGRPIVRVWAAAGSSPAVPIDVDREQFEDAARRGLSPRWCINVAKGRPYVRACCSGDPRTLVSVAHFLMGDPRDQQVRFRDGDRLNLRRWNLDLRERHGVRRSAGEPVDPGGFYVPARDHASESRPRHAPAP